MDLCVVAVGGNALQPPEGDALAVAPLRQRVARAMDRLAALARDHELVVTHGNGPQVGAIFDSQPGAGLAAAVAQSQGLLGTALVQAMRARLPEPSCCILTHVRVNPEDPAFKQPTKPIGPALLESQARSLRAKGVKVGFQDGRWRRLVASPLPLEVLESGEIGRLAASSNVVAAGGGGIPVAGPNDRLRFVDCVVDKDWASAHLAIALGAEALHILTDVPHVFLDHGTPHATPLTKLTAGEARRHLAAGQFPPGSMGPKVEAALWFLKHNPTGTVAIGPLQGDGQGTRILP